MSASLDISIACDMAEIGRLADAVESYCRTASVPEAMASQMALALDEIVTNTINHASADGGIDIRLTVADGELVAVIEDGAAPFDPRTIDSPDTKASLDQREPGGLGLLLVRSLMDRFDYERIDDRNRVTLAKRLE